MVYLWKLPKYLANKHIAAYDEEISTDRFLFLHGVKLKPEQVDKKLIFKLKVNQAEIAKFDCIPNNANAPLINQKIVDLFLMLAPGEVQFFDAEVHCKDGILMGYKLLNATRMIKGVDREKSIYTTMLPPNEHEILMFKYLTYKPGCMGNYKLARDEEYFSNLLATEEIKQAFEKAKIKGMRFVRPEEFYRPLKPEDLID